MTVGSKVGFPGESVPLVGNSEIRQSGSTAIDVVTITLSTATASAADGRGLVISGSTVAAAVGNAASGVPIAFAVDYTGARGGQHVITLSTASCQVTLSASQSGSLIVIGDNTGTDMNITLPAAQKGMWFEFYQAGSVKASGTWVNSATAAMIVTFNNEGVNGINIGGATGAAVGGSIRLISDGALWYCIEQPAFGSAAFATNTMTLFGTAS